jgi:hypothetical protein
VIGLLLGIIFSAFLGLCSNCFDFEICYYISEIMAFSEGSIRNNAMVVEYCRTSMGNNYRFL